MFIEAVVSSIFEIKLFRVFELKTAVYFQQTACNFIEKENLTQVFSCQFREISKNTFCYKTPQVAASLNKENCEEEKCNFVTV